MPGITITPGVFNPVATPAEVGRLLTFPRTVVATVPRRWMQFQTRGAGLPPDEDFFDDSALVVPAEDLWVATFGSNGWLGRRMVQMQIEWRNMPAGTRIGGLLSETDGTRMIEIGFGFQVRSSFSDQPESLFSGDLNGRDYAADVQTVHRDFMVGSVSVQYLRTGLSTLFLAVTDGGGGVLADFRIEPKVSTTCRMCRVRGAS